MSVTPSLIENLLHRLHILPTPVLDSFGAVIFARALTVGLRRGLFESVSARPMPADELARETGLSVEGVRLLAEACVAGGYLASRKGMYSAGPEAKKWLLRSSETYLGDLILYFDSLNRRLGGLEYSLEHGEPREPYYAAFTDSDWETYVRGMANLARLLMPHVAGKIRLPEGGGKVLDLGGSHGLYALECCRRNPGCSATVMDFAPALRQASAFHEGGFGNRVILSAADILTSPLPPGQDAVLMFNIVHGFDRETNSTLVARASASLAPGGRLYILDQVSDNGRGSPLSRFIPLMVGLNLMNEIGGTTYTPQAIRAWCAGAASFNVIPLRIPGVTLIEAGDWNSHHVRTP